MLLNATLELEAPPQTTIPEEGGEKLHGLFFDLLKSVDPDLATSIHDQEGKPFAISTLRSLARRSSPTTPSETPVSAAERSGQKNARRWRFTIRSLDRRLSEVIDQAATAWEGRAVRIGNTPLAIRAIGITKKTYEQLYTETECHNPIHVRFLTPTSFRQRGTQVVLPIPELVFGSLLRRWNQYSPMPFPESLAEEFAAIRIRKHNIRTELYRFDRYKIIGFAGDVVFEFATTNPVTPILFNALARFAEYSGVGYKSTMGMGETRIIQSTSERTRRNMLPVTCCGDRLSVTPVSPAAN
ncbi:CRISPR-associated endoribonuclease Cas6 [Heliobacterium gestii]|uniref:CRISPR-associated endoribonuclease Cas6 n=1 Tax=Heliomicrobium gestii TaxID=2699 RepID=A0A845L743_HELGE|nr:CRISPR-associated endoribonuclease Cas6 [Heliomicrobium gestii]MBM7865804.1 CRISPR-associated endoribonuclease Cas6 [Heliomicrobium gestii]MZP42048.1 CRISPR-associated endoribonuclease Cas6 [Heliomicrobium gestii]